MAEEVGKAKVWKHKRMHKMVSEMRDVGLLVVLSWEYLSE